MPRHRQISRQSKVVTTLSAVVSVAGIASFGETLTVVATLYTSKKGDQDFSEKVRQPAQQQHREGRGSARVPAFLVSSLAKTHTRTRWLFLAGSIPGLMRGPGPGLTSAHGCSGLRSNEPVYPHSPASSLHRPQPQTPTWPRLAHLCAPLRGARYSLSTR